MHNIEITMEKTVRVSRFFEVPDSVYEEIKRINRIPDDYFYEMKKMCDGIEEYSESERRDMNNKEVANWDATYDYAVYDEDCGKQLIEWSW